MAQVIIVSNRLPVSIKKDKGKLTFSPSIGGLATGLSSYVHKRGNNLWIGWPGIASDDLSLSDKQEITKQLAKLNYVPVFLTEKQIDYFYNGYSNSILWPVFHGLPQRSIDEHEAEKWWKSYANINRMFSETILSRLTSKSQVWIHDYQLLLAPEMIRAEQPTTSIGFFLHIPFPGFKLLNKIHHADKLLKGVLGADLIGFHTTSYVNNFLECLRQFDQGEIVGPQVLYHNRSIKVAEFPMGIDYEKFSQAAKLKGVKQIAKSYRRKYKHQKIIASVDRLDPSKGLVERLKAYQKFLRGNPRLHGKVVFVMIAAPSRTNIIEYQNLAKKLDKLAQEINEEFGDSIWQPLEYINQSMPFENVTALFQIADVAFITPIRDGMNLAAKEFIASNKRGGVLILSSTAGAAEELKDALLINPKKPETMVEALNTALSMRRRELRSRLNKMRRHLSSHTVQDWAKTFIDTLQQPLPGTPHITRTINRRLEAKILKEYGSSNKRLFLLDYDGSLVKFADNYADAKPPKEVLNLLRSLASQEENEIVLISGRNSEELQEWFGDLPINLVAEHGANVKLIGRGWEPTAKEDTDWRQLLLPPLEKYAALTPGATVEIKPYSLVWHYRGAPAYYAQKYSVIIRKSLKPILKKQGLELMQGNKVLEIKNPAVSKGAAAKRWLNGDYGFILAIGDDITDEDLFAVLPPTANSIKVGRGLSKAHYRLNSSSEVLDLLKFLT